MQTPVTPHDYRALIREGMAEVVGDRELGHMPAKLAGIAVEDVVISTLKYLERVGLIEVHPSVPVRERKR